MKTRSGHYGGRTAEERQADRRHRLIEAAREIWGEHGWAAVTMRGVCAKAGLIDRYFYENFADRDALLLAVWDQTLDETVQQLLTAFTAAPREPVAQLRAAIAVVVREIRANPQRARIGFGEHAGSAGLEQRRRDTVQHFTDLLLEAGRPYFVPGADETALRMTTLMGIGGFIELMTAWLAGTVTADAEQIIDHTTSVGADLAARYLTVSVPR